MVLIKHMIYDFLRRIGLSELNRGSRLPAEILGPDEWGVSALARQLGMPTDTLCHWCARGWVGHHSAGVLPLNSGSSPEKSLFDHESQALAIGVCVFRRLSG